MCATCGPRWTFIRGGGVEGPGPSLPSNIGGWIVTSCNVDILTRIVVADVVSPLRDFRGQSASASHLTGTPHPFLSFRMLLPDAEVGS